MSGERLPPAVILAGGLGTRLRSVLDDRPKVLAPVGGYPFLHRLLAHLAESGVRDVVLAVGHGADRVERACGNGRAFGLRIRYSVEPEPLGTAGALRRAATLLDGGPFLAMNGDSFIDAPFSRLLRMHAEHEAGMTVLLAPARDRSRFGSVELAEDGRIIDFHEKDTGDAGLVSAGVYVVGADALATVPANQAVSLETEVLPRLAGDSLYGIVRDARLVDIGTPASYAAAQSYFVTRRTPGESILRAGSMRNGIALLDRDGTINREVEYLSDPDELELLDGAAEAIRRLHNAGFTVAVVTNQSAVGRGWLEPAMLERIHDRLLELLAAEGATVAGIYACPHAPKDGCGCRKPRPGMLERALTDFGFDAEDAFMVGDNRTDIEAGARLGARTVLVRTGYGRRTEADAPGLADAVADDLLGAVEVITGLARTPAGGGVR